MTRPAVIAGGGLAGAAAACILARAGRPVVLFEREAGPVDKVCGEFVSAEAQDYLRHLGLDLAALGGERIEGFRLVHGESVAGCALPFAGLGLSRRVLDEALLGLAARRGAVVRRGCRVSIRQQSICHDRGPFVLATADGRTIETDTLFLATGKHELRGLRRAHAATPDLVGFKLHLRLSPAQRDALAGHVEIVMLERGYAGLQLVENGMANLCLLVARGALLDAGGDWDGLLAQLRRTAPHLRRRLDGAETAMPRPLTIFRVPYGFVHAPGPGDDAPGLYRLGDQAGVIASFTGDGMSIALHSAVTAAACHTGGGSAADYHRLIHADIARQIARADALYRLGGGPLARAAVMRAARLWPGGLRLAARLTRVPRRAVARSLAGLPPILARAAE
jgi:flavin-dependent dehydrogenase